jgi:poly(3-hydroxybutyrate) depolymerase
MFHNSVREKAKAGRLYCFQINEPHTIKWEYLQSVTLNVFKSVFILFPFLAFAANTPPLVDAGPALRVVFPTTVSTILSGNGTDKEGPVTFKWKQVGGNSTAAIAQPTSAITTVSKLKPGLYTFVLTATDNTGTSTTDTTTVSVLKKITWTINGIPREALVHPATGGTGLAPVIFAFHGHGGTDSGYAEKAFELSWPEAIVVYPQGLRTSTPVDSNCREAGWQEAVGEVNCFNGNVNQDLKFFDAMLKKLKKLYPVDSNLVFVHGWSNGADFIYNVLWASRRNKIAALAPAGGNMDTTFGKHPIPVIAIAGTEDDKIPFEEQQRDVSNVRLLNKCSSTGTKWATGPSGLLATRYESPVNAPVIFLQYIGPHRYPFTVPPLIVRFFKEVAATTTQPLITKIFPPLVNNMNESLAAK